MAVSVLNLKNKHVCRDTLELLEDRIVPATAEGQVHGSLIIVADASGGYTVHASGILKENPTFASGAAMVAVIEMAMKARAR